MGKKFHGKRFYDCVIHPRNMRDCPTGLNDCDNCDYREYIGTFGGEYYIDCTYDDDETLDS